MRRTTARFREPGYARRYDDDRYGGAFGAWLRDREATLFGELLDGRAAELLDAGGGTGKLGLALADAATTTAVCDFSLSMLRRCREAGRAEGTPLLLAAADLEALPFADRAFEAVVCSRVLMHLEGWERGIAELCRVSRRRLVIDVPVTGSVAGVDAALKRWVGGRGRWLGPGYRTFSVADVTRELERNGFTVERTDRGFVLPFRLHRWVDRPGLSEAVEASLARAGLTRGLGSPATIGAARRRGSP